MYGRLSGVLALALSGALLVASFVGVTWFDNTLVGRADFGDVLASGQRGGFIGPLSDAESGWFQGLLLGPIVVAALLLLTSMPRSRPARMTAGILWLLPAIAAFVALPFLIADEVRLTDESTYYADDQTERVVTAVVVDGLVIVTLIIVAWAAYRGRTVGLAAIGTAVALAAVAIHVVLMVKLLQGTGTERVSVAVGPWLVAVGLAGMAIAGWLLTTDASRSRSQPAASPPESQPIPQRRQSPNTSGSAAGGLAGRDHHGIENR